MKISQNNIHKWLKYFFSGIAIIFLFQQLFLPTPQARTIALVYDDSGSMKGKSKWVYANYASQSLAALLRQDDELAAVLMSVPGSLKQMSPGKSAIETIKKEWRAGGETPYKSVQTAMDALLKSVSAQTAAFDKQKQNWLIVMTDGQFFKTMSAAEKIKFKDNLRGDFIDQTRGQVRIVFLLIGADADKLVPHLWEEVAPEQVEIITAKDEKEIFQKMSQIAAMITGRDFRDTDISKKEKEIHFTSLFPVRRVTVFEQGTTVTLATVEGMTLPVSPQKPDLRIEALNIRSPQGNLAGKATHCHSQQIMPAGEYQIRFKENIANRPIQVLLETAVDFRVILRDANQNIPVPNAQGIFKLCQDQNATVEVRFLKADTDEPLPLDATNTKDLKVNISFDSSIKPLLCDSNTNQFNPMPFIVTKERQTLSVEAGCPGYFHLKSNVLRIEGENCIVDKAMGISANEIRIPYIYSKTPVSIRQPIDLRVEVAGGGREKIQAAHKLSAQGIPSGITLRVKEKSLTTEQPEIEIPMLPQGETLPIEILRNQDYQEDAPATVTLRISSDDPMIHWKKDQITLTLKPQPRTITLEPSDTKWSAPVMNLKQSEPLEVNLKADGKIISGEELNAWNFEYDVPGRIGVQITPDNTRSVFRIRPRPYLYCTCWTSGGQLPVKITAMGPFPSETYSETIFLNIEDAPWWKKCLHLILGILFTLIFLWWLIGIIKKPRFAKGSVITLQRIQARIESRPRTESLPGSWFSRWVIPYIPEKKSIGKFTFTPGRTSGSVMITKAQERDNITIDGSYQERPWRHDLKLGRNSTLEEEVGNRTEKYTYI